MIRQKGLPQVYSPYIDSASPVLRQKDMSYAHGIYASSDNIISYVEDWIHLLENTSSERIHQRETHFTYGQVEAKFSTEFGPVLIRITLPRSAGLSKWVTRVLQLSIEGHEDAALKEISLSIMQVKAKEEFSKLSGDLVSFDLKTLPDIVLVALLRNTFSIRSQISCWNSLIAQTEQLLQEREQDPRSLLRGLKSYS
jgi:hypothetical protein